MSRPIRLAAASAALADPSASRSDAVAESRIVDLVECVTDGAGGDFASG